MADAKYITPLQSLKNDAALLSSIVGDTFAATVPAAPRVQSALEVARTAPGLQGAAMGSLMGPQNPPPAPPLRPRQAAALPQTPINAGGDADAFAALPPGEDNGLGFFANVMLDEKQQKYLIDQQKKIAATKAAATAPAATAPAAKTDNAPLFSDIMAPRVGADAEKKPYTLTDFLRDSKNMSAAQLDAYSRTRPNAPAPLGYKDVAGFNLLNAINTQANAVFTDPNATDQMKLDAYNKAQEDMWRFFNGGEKSLMETLAEMQAQQGG